MEYTDIEEIRQLKKNQRKLCLEKRQSLSDTQRREKSKVICEYLATIPELQNAEMIFSYMASYDEADPSYLLQNEIFAGKTFCYPISLDGGIMEARIPAKENGWEEGRFGIKSPKVENSTLVDPADIDVIIVPCVGFDSEKKRLGHGKGYYDRYFEKYSKTLKICIAFDAQMIDNVAVDVFDVPMDLVVTESGICK